MQINFYKYAIPVNPVKEFGLVDPDDKEGKKPASVSYDKTSDKWNAKVECNNRTDYSFIAVDNNVPLTVKNNGKDETASSCCNSRRPFVPSIHKIAQQQFMQKNKIVLRIKTEIEELK